MNVDRAQAIYTSRHRRHHTAWARAKWHGRRAQHFIDRALTAYELGFHGRAHRLISLAADILTQFDRYNDTAARAATNRRSRT